VADRFETAFLEEDAFAEWDRLVERSPEGTVFQTARWFRILGDALEKEWRVLGCFKNGNLVGGCAGLLSRRAGLELWLPPMLTGYAGPVLGEPDQKRLCERNDETLRRGAAIEEALRRRFALAWMVHHPAAPDLRPYVWSGWEMIPRYTFLLRSAPAEKMRGALKHSLRKQIKKAERAGLRARPLEDLSGVAGLYAASYRRHGEPPPVSPEAIARWFARLSGEGAARAWAAEGEDGAPHAFLIAILDGDRAYHWVAGSDTDRIKEGGMPFLLWKTTEELAGVVSSIDMMGANTPTIAGFKTGFGGELVPYWETKRFRSPFVRALFRARERFGR